MDGLSRWMSSLDGCAIKCMMSYRCVGADVRFGF